MGLFLLYRQSSGQLCLADDDGQRIPLVRAYSGRGSGRNNPDAERQIAVGPIPRGVWRLDPPADHPRLGPAAIRCYPVGHNAHGRTEFFIHGDNARNDASRGCIIAPRAIRQTIGLLGLKAMEVVTI